MATIVKSAQPTPSFELFSRSYDVVKRNLNNFALLSILPFLTLISGQIFERRGATHNGSADYLSDWGNVAGVGGLGLVGWISLGIVGFLFIVVATLIVQAMTFGLELEGAKGHTPSLNSLWETGKKYWLRLFGFFIIYGFLIAGGLLLLVIPGLIVIRRYFLVPYIMIEKDLPILKAMEQSASLTKPYSKSIWGIIGVMLVLSLPSFIPVIGVFIAFVLSICYSVAPALRYQELKKLRPAA